MGSSEDSDIEQSLYMNRMEGKGGELRKTTLLPPCSSKPGTAHPEGCRKVVGSLLYLLSIKTSRIYVQDTCVSTHTHMYTCLYSKIADAVFI